MSKTGKVSPGLITPEMTVAFNVLQRKAGKLRVLNMPPCRGKW